MIRPHILSDFAENYKVHGFDSRAFVASYGMAETTLAISFAPLEHGILTDTIDLQHLETEQFARGVNNSESPKRTFVVCGRPLPGHHIEAWDSEGKTLPDRAIGTIYVRGPSMMTGYFGRRRRRMLSCPPMVGLIQVTSATC